MIGVHIDPISKIGGQQVAIPFSHLSTKIRTKYIFDKNGLLQLVSCQINDMSNKFYEIQSIS